MLITLILGFLLLSSCTVDLLGFFASNDYGTRLKDRNKFVLLSGGDRAPAFGDSYSFVVLSDTHIEGDNTWRLEEIKDKLEPTDAFVIITGDITQSGQRSELQKFIDIAKSINIPCYPVIGNHDIYFNNWSNWRDLIGSTSYRIDSSTGTKKTTLFILDSANESLGANQLNWLENEIKTVAPGSHVFVFSHTNIFVESITNIQQQADIRERNRILSILDGRCDAMFMGHLHRRIERSINGTDYIAIEDFVHSKIYCRVWVSPDGIRWEYKKL